MELTLENIPVSPPAPLVVALPVTVDGGVATKFCAYTTLRALFIRQMAHVRWAAPQVCELADVPPLSNTSVSV